MNTAENQETGTGTPSAGGQEHFIPKHRFDEISARLRDKEEEVRMKDDLIRQTLANRQQPQTENEPTINAEELGIDPQVAQAAAKIAKSLVSHEMKRARQEVNGLIGQMGQELDVTKFLMNHGKDKQSYLASIDEYRQRHLRTTGQWMDAETAFKLIRFDEMERAAARRSAQDPAQSPAPAASPASAANPTPASAGPSAAGTRVNPGPVAPGGSAKRFDELTLEEQEARLEEAFREGNSA